MNGRAGGAIGGTVLAVAVVAGFNFGLGQVIKEDEPAPPAPRDAAFKLTLEGDDRTEHTLIAEGLSGLPPSRRVELVSEDGRKTATVWFPRGNCATTDRRNAGYTGPRETEWCLRFVNAPDHGVMTGVAKGRQEKNTGVPPAKLALTLSTRDPFRWLPLAVVAGGILASLLIALGGALWLPVVAGNRLARLLKRGANIAGLDTRADELRAEGKSADAIVVILAPVVDKGPKRAREARAALRKTLANNPLPENPKYMAAAAAEAGRTDYKVDDFLAPDDSQADHPADRFKAGLTPMRAYHGRFVAAMTEIEETLKEPCKQEPRVAYQAAKLAWSEIEKPEDIATLEGEFDQARKVLRQKLAPDADCLKPDLKGASAEPQVEARPIDATIPMGQVLGEVGRGSALVALIAATFGAIVVAGLLAGFGVWLATYDPVKTFGSWRDYAALATAALATGVVANVTAILKPWK